MKRSYNPIAEGKYTENYIKKPIESYYKKNPIYFQKLKIYKSPCKYVRPVYLQFAKETFVHVSDFLLKYFLDMSQY